MDGLQGHACMSQSALLFFPSDHTQALIMWSVNLYPNRREQETMESKEQEGETYLLLLRALTASYSA